MESIEEFRKVATNIKELEQQLLLINESTKEYEALYERAKGKIEEHFEKLIEVLAVRKLSLLGDLGEMVKHQSIPLLVLLYIFLIFAFFFAPLFYLSFSKLIFSFFYFQSESCIGLILGSTTNN